MSILQLITSPEAATRDQALDAWCAGRDLSALLAAWT